MSAVTSRDHPSAVLKATMRAGCSYWPSVRCRTSVARHLAFSQVPHQRGATGILFGSFAPGAAEPSPKVLKHEIDITVGWGDRHN